MKILVKSLIKERDSIILLKLLKSKNKRLNKKFIYLCGLIFKH